MSITVPQLDVYYIDYTKENTSKTPSVLGKLGKIAAISLLPGGPLLKSAMMLVSKTSLTQEIYDGIKGLIDQNRFHIIQNPQELSVFENVYGNEWVINNKALKRKQYYIRHPKLANRNLLIESQAFHEYIEEEQKDELIDFIMAHCSVKSIQIDRTELSDFNGNAKANIKDAEVSVGVNGSKLQGNYYSVTFANGSKKTELRPNYYWIDKSLMRTISAMTEGSSIFQEYQIDMTFGLSLNEAKTVGLDMGRHKKYSYKIQIIC